MTDKGINIQLSTSYLHTVLWNYKMHTTRDVTKVMLKKKNCSRFWKVDFQFYRY